MKLITTLALSLLSTSAMAQDFSFGVGTDNRSKGVSKSGENAYAWIAAEWEFDSSVYAGSNLQTIESSSGANLEATINTGFRPEVAEFDLDLSVAYKTQIDTPSGYDADAWEFTADAKRSFGPVATRVRLQYSPDGIGSTQDWTWVEARIGVRLDERLVTNAAVGYRDQASPYTAWNVGATYELTSNTDLDVRYYDTSHQDSSVVASISIAF